MQWGILTKWLDESIDRGFTVYNWNEYYKPVDMDPFDKHPHVELSGIRPKTLQKLIVTAGR